MVMYSWCVFTIIFILFFGSCCRFVANRIKDRSKAIVCCLARGHSKCSEYSMLIERNKRLESLQWALQYDHVIFHEGNITEEHRAYIHSQSPDLQLKFVDVSDSFSRDARKVPTETECASIPEWPIGYKRMCRFWFVDFWQYVKGYRYLVRFDDDVHLRRDCLDPVMYCKRFDIKYACPHIMGEPDVVIDGLQKYTTLSAHEVHHVPGTHTQVIDLQYYSRPCVTDFIQLIDQTGCQLFNRWGDAPLIGILVRQFTPKTQYNFEWKGFKGIHGSHNSELSR
jgi:hypothetical protein